MTGDALTYWNDQAATFDEEADHGLRDPAVRDAWARLLLAQLPPVPAVVADLGCGTGSLSCLLADAGYTVRGLDLSPRMVEAARAKAGSRGLDAVFEVGEASAPDLPPESVDVVLVRHLLWALPDPDLALARWTRLLRPSGRLVLIEGRWHTGTGLSADETRTLLLRHRTEARVRLLTDPALWGGPTDDERYLVLSRR